MKGLAALEKRITKIPANTRKELKISLEEGADRLVSLQKSLAPRRDGDLIDSIQKREGQHDLAVEVTAGSKKAFHAKFQEHGTKRNQANPFFFPAYRALKRSIQARVNVSIRKAAKRDATS